MEKHITCYYAHKILNSPDAVWIGNLLLETSVGRSLAGIVVIPLTVAVRLSNFILPPLILRFGK